MRKSGSILRAPKVRFRAVLSAAILLAAAAGLSVAGNAAASPTPAPTGIVAVASTYHPNSDLGGAVPDVLVAAGDLFTLTITLSPDGATFNTATKLDLSAALFSGDHPSGSLSVPSVTMPAGVPSATFDLSYTGVDNGVQVTAAVAKTKGKTSTVTKGMTAPFDVLKTLKPITPADNTELATGLGVGNANCTAATTESECGTLVLSHGLPSQAGALSLGACTPDLGCTSGSQVVQFISNLGTAYPPNDPALLIIRCSKPQCAGRGINYYTLKVSQSASGPLSESLPCVSKGVALDANGNTFCTDYVQSHRDNAGDALLYFLFTDDMRAST
jgi:hypothetical protein